jgi:hypothetical protein
MASIDSLKTELQTSAALLTNSTAKYKCLVLIDQYIDALNAQASAAASDIQSYSIAGRSVNRRAQDSHASAVSSLWKQISALLYGSQTTADFSGMHDNMRVGL